MGSTRPLPTGEPILFFFFFFFFVFFFFFFCWHDRVHPDLVRRKLAPPFSRHICSNRLPWGCGIGRPPRSSDHEAEVDRLLMMRPARALCALMQTRRAAHENWLLETSPPNTRVPLLPRMCRGVLCCLEISTGCYTTENVYAARSARRPRRRRDDCLNTDRDQKDITCGEHGRHPRPASPGKYAATKTPSPRACTDHINRRPARP